MSILEAIMDRARQRPQRVVLPETEDERTLRAVVQLLETKTAIPVLVGKPDQVQALAGRIGARLEGVEILDPEADPELDEYAKAYQKRRAKENLTLEQARRLMTNPLYYGAALVAAGRVAGMTAGAAHATADVLRPAIRVIGTAPGIRTVSSCFIMVMPDPKWGEQGVMIFADSAVVPDPDASQLADIAESSAHTARVLCGFAEPRVAMLSFSTKGSAEHPRVEKVRAAVQILHQRAPDLVVDGEMQADAALVPSVGEKKAPGSPVAGRANVLIFPDLDSANIGYKLVQRLAGAEAIGPVIQGLRKPVNDLSRGASVNDIAMVAAITGILGAGQ